ncbi:MAG: hypothetical protein JWM95_25 [Gemmatimonadetes bacterium]|nr:hypothetical protein [Gemmatimonadota bacterium]
MAKVNNMAMITTMATIPQIIANAMDEPDVRSDAASRGSRAEAIIADLFEHADWRVRRDERPDSAGSNLIVRRGRTTLLVQVKAAAEGRADRLIPLWSQAYLEALRAAGDKHQPLTVIAAPRIAPRAAEQVLKFAADVAPEAAIGVIDFEGLREFRGPQLEHLSAEHSPAPARIRSAVQGQSDIFSDLNQWMLKVLLATELPEKLLSAPRIRYQNASQLARAANVSVMSAFRFVQQLERDGYLHESSGSLELVRRGDLFRRWREAAARRVIEVPVRFLLRGDPQKELARTLRSGRGCLALFAAAKALGFGFVQGVLPHVYVQRLDPASIAEWKNIVVAGPGEQPDILLRQAPAPQSVYRGLVRVNDTPVSDILQVWLDVSNSPSRGAEQADLIQRRILDKLISGAHANR